MKKLNKLLLLFFSIALLMIFLRFFLFLSFPYSEFAASQSKSNTLYAGYPVVQKFTAERDSLRQVNFAIRDFPKFPGDKIIFELMDADCSNPVAKDSINSSSLTHPAYTPFRLAKIPDSGGKQYCAKITFRPLIKRNFSLPQILSIKIKTDPQTKFSNLGAKDGLGKHYKDQSLAMKPAYGSGNIFGDIETLNKRISQFKPWFLKGYCLLAIALLFIILSVLVVIILIFL